MFKLIILFEVAHHCKRLKILRVQRCPPLNYTDLELLSTSCTDLECLNLDTTGLYEVDIFFNILYLDD